MLQKHSLLSRKKWSREALKKKEKRFLQAIREGNESKIMQALK